MNPELINPGHQETNSPKVSQIWFFGTFYGEPSSKSMKALLCRHFIENMGIIVYNPCPVRVL